MRVRIVSGNQAGQVVDQPQIEAECNIAFGYAVPVGDEPAPSKKDVEKKIRFKSRSENEE